MARSRSRSLIESSSQLQDAPKCRTDACGAVLFLLLSVLLLALCVDYITATPWADLPELGHRRYFYEPSSSGNESDNGQFCHEYGVNYDNVTSGRTFTIRTQDECALAATSLGLRFSDTSKPPCVSGCCINASGKMLLFSDSVRIYPASGDFPAVCTSQSVNLYKLSAIAVIVISGVPLAGCVLFLVVVLRSDSSMLRVANAYVRNNPGEVCSVEISFGALQRQQEYMASSGSWSARCIILAVVAASLAGMAAGGFVISVVVTPNDWLSWRTTFVYVFTFGFTVGAGFGLLVACFRLIEKTYGEKARARSLSYMQMHLFFVPPDGDVNLARQPSICIVRGERCHVLRSLGREPTATLEDRGLTICSSELVKESDRNLESSSSLAFADWSLKVGYAKVTANNMFNQIMRLDRGFLHFYFEGDSEALRLHSWLQSSPEFCYRGCQNDFDSGGASRIITLKRDADASILGSLLSGAQALEIDVRREELAGSLRCRLADALRVHPSRLSLFRQGGTLHDRLAVGDIDSVVVCERHEVSAADAVTA